MLDLTVIILTKNEENNIKKCIKSFSNIVKRFVIVDSFSTDNTKDVCLELSKKLKKSGISLDFYENKWIDYEKQFNWALEHTNIQTQWIMRMDSDEELTNELVEEMIIRLPKLEKRVNGVILKRRLIFFGKWIRHGGKYPEYLLRIIRRETGYCEHTVMDEHLVLKNGDSINFKNDLIDHNTKSLDWWISKHNWYSNRERDNYFYLAGKNEKITKNLSKQAKIRRFFKSQLYYKLPLFFRAHLYFVYRYYFRLGFLDGKEGKIYHFLQAYWYRFMVDSKIFEEKEREKK